MRNTLIGTGLAVLLIGLLFWLDSTITHPTPEQTAALAANQIDKGFVGVRLVGVWQVACQPSPMVVGNQPKSSSAQSDASGDQESKPHSGNGNPPAKPVSLGRCRATLEVASPARPRRPFLTINFRLLGDDKRLTMIVRFVPIAHKGDVVLLGLGRGVLKVPVSGCLPGSCVAITGVPNAARTALLSAPGGVLVLPSDASRRRLRVRVPFLGLAPSIAAIERAQG